MDIVSYRGPDMAGGVSAALSRVWCTQQDKSALWWYVTDNCFTMRALSREEPLAVEQLPEEIVKGHYRYCNEFLWPLMHDLPQYASFSARDRQFYEQFNLMAAQRLTAMDRGEVSRFVQDYQLALLPGLLNVFSNNQTLVFWHIPWPKNVHQLHVQPLAALACGLLGARNIGFQTEEYAQDFMQFVQQYIPGYAINRNQKMIVRSQKSCAVASLPWRNIATAVGENSRRTRDGSVASYGKMLSSYAAEQTEVTVAPLGLDLDYWTRLSDNVTSSFDDPSLEALFHTKLVLSVDRADYTKAVVERIHAIGLFFDLYPQYQGQVSFVQICGKTRSDLPAFHRYWEQCRRAADQLDARHARDAWKPLVWLDKPVSCDDLARLYARVDAMLVNPVRDGLNLTAKEFVACRRPENLGVLLLSQAAGVWHELQPYAIEINPRDTGQMARAIAKALDMTDAEKDARMLSMKRRLESNTLQDWWNKFQSSQHSAPPAVLTRPRLF